MRERSCERFGGYKTLNRILYLSLYLPLFLTTLLPPFTFFLSLLTPLSPLSPAWTHRKHQQILLFLPYLSILLHLLSPLPFPSPSFLGCHIESNYHHPSFPSPPLITLLAPSHPSPHPFLPLPLPNGTWIALSMLPHRCHHPPI